MAVGYSATIGAQNLNSMLGAAAVARRDAAVAAFKLWSVVHSLGADEDAQIAALAARPGWDDTATDPQAFWTDANRLYADAQIYYGELAQPEPFNYDDALALVRAGQ